MTTRSTTLTDRPRRLLEPRVREMPADRAASEQPHPERRPAGSRLLAAISAPLGDSPFEIIAL